MAEANTPTTSEAPEPAAQTAPVPSTLWDALGTIADRRGRKGRQYPLQALLAIAIAAVLAGANDLEAIFRWGRCLEPEALAVFGLEKAPCHSQWFYFFRSLVNRRANLTATAHCLTKNVTGELTARTGAATPNRIGVADGGTDQHGRAARGHGGGGGTLPVGGAGGEGADSRRAVQGDWLASQARGARAGRPAGDRTVTGHDSASRPTARSSRMRWWRCGRRPTGSAASGSKVMIPTLLPALERHGRLKLGEGRSRAGAGGQRGNDRPAAGRHQDRGGGGKRRRVGFYSAIRREVPIRTFNDWNDPPPGFCEVDMVAHGGTIVAGSFIQTLTMVDVATGWTECLPLVTREGGLVVEAMERAQSLFPWLVLRRRLRQRQRVHERRRRPLVPRTEDRGDALARLQEERSGVRRAEERRGRAAAGRLRPLRRHRDGAA